MKLVRLTTTDNNAKFNVNFDTDIKLEKNSKIALHSTSFEVDNQGIEIGPHNRRVEFKVDKNGVLNGFELVDRVVNTANFGDLFTELTNKMNAQLTYTASNVVENNLGLQ